MLVTQALPLVEVAGGHREMGRQFGEQLRDEVREYSEMWLGKASHRSGLLAYYDVMITSGPMEGTNNKIKTMKRQAYGFRDREFFKLKILAIHETRYELVG